MSTYPLALKQASTRPIYTDDIRFIDSPSFNNASWIWTNDSAPSTGFTEQRAFRMTYPYPVFQNGTPIQPSLATIYAAADDYFVMYVNGALVHPADPQHNLSKLVAFDVPLPVMQRSSRQEEGLTLGFRVVNRNGFAGLLVGAVVKWEDGFVGKTEDPSFYTGTDQDPNVVGTWYGERLYEERWEQPDGLKRSEVVKWDPAVLIPENARPPKQGRWSGDVLDNFVKVFERLELSSSSNTTVSDQSSSTPSGVQCQSSPGGVNISSGQLAGVLVGSLLTMAILASLVTWVLTRRHFSRPRKH
ncbi:hypothetical protein NMY22_g6597 [Coprinellus aureogranulatus]|nr:hypothetical protein NMY22_g6597 [Coprinellus aureogranulatus]